jgi:EAL domain-containing protein (putative c-di-GMP-specific phosphodiesterase class I)
VVEESGGSPAAGRFLRETVTAARAADLLVIAEGVEDVEGWQRMRELGVDQVQGYLISHPLRAAAVGAWLQEWQLTGA